jgi:hypothetical protein
MPPAAPAYDGSPQPVPQLFDVQAAVGPAGRAVVLTFRGFCGQWTVFLDENGARAIAAQLTQAMSGLIVPLGLDAWTEGRGSDPTAVPFCAE